jgi:hypothetical protein
MFRSMFCKVALVAVVCGSLLGSAYAIPIHYDDFNGSALSSSLWTNTACGDLGGVSGGFATWHDSAGWAGTYSTQTFGNGSDESQLYLFKLGGLPASTGSSINLGLRDFDSHDSVLLKSYSGSTDWHLEINNADVGESFTVGIGDELALKRTGGYWQGYKNGLLVSTSPILDNVQSSDNLRFFVATGPEVSVQLDWVGTATVVPEPSTLSLLVAALFGFACYAWRKGR